MALKSMKYCFTLALCLSLFTSINGQCESETINSALTINMDACASNTIAGTNVDYSELTASTSNAGICNNVFLAAGPNGQNIYRNNPTENPHSCAPGINGTPAMCVEYDQGCDYIPDSDRAVRFDVVVEPLNGPTSLLGLSFYELAPETFTYLGGISGTNNYPTQYAVRVVVNGVEVFLEQDIATSTDWSLEVFDFVGNPAFTVNQPTTFEFELTAYCRINNGFDVAVWDLDEIQVATTCESIPATIDATFQIAGGQTASSCNGTTFSFVNGTSAPSGSTCTWYFDWPNTDPSTTFIGENPTYTFPAEGIYTVRKEISFGNCFDSFEMQVSAFDTGIEAGSSTISGGGPGIAGMDIVLSACNANQYTVNLTSTAFDTNAGFAVNSWNWLITINGVPQAVTGESISIVVNSTDAVSVTLDVLSTSGCSGTFSGSFNAADLLPPVSFVATLIECTDTGFIIQISDNTNLGNLQVANYGWSVLVDGQTIDPGNVPTFTVETISDVISVTHTNTYTNGCSSTVSDSISVINNLVPVFEMNIVGGGPGSGGGGGTIDCENGVDQVLEITITGGSISGNVTSIDWVVTLNGQTFTFTGNPVDLMGLITGTAVVTATINYDNGCSFTVTKTYTPGDFGGGGMSNIDVNFNGNPVIDCNGDVTPVLLNPNPNYTYSWDPTTGLTFTDLVSFSDPVVSVTEITVYNVTITDGPCFIDTSIMVIPEDLSIPDLEVGGLGVNGNLFCDNVVIEILNPIPGVNYEWTCEGTVIGTGTILDYDPPSDFTTKEICASIATTAACDISSCVTVINGNPDVTYQNPFEMCPGDTVQYEIINNDPSEVLVYTFEDDPHIVGFDADGIPILGMGDKDTVVTIPFTIANEFCILEDTLEILPTMNEQLDFDWSLEECGEYTICFEALNIDSLSGVPCWDFGDLSTDADTSTMFNPCYTYPDTGLYVVVLIDKAELCPGFPVEIEIGVPLEPSISIEQTSGPDPLIFEATVVNADPEDVTWCDENGDQIGTGPILEIPASDSIMMVTGKIEDEFGYGCEDSATLEVDSTEDDPPFSDVGDVFGADDGVCPMDTFTLQLEVEDPGAYTFLWGPDDCIIGTAIDTIVTVTVGDTDKEFTVVVTDTLTMMDTTITYLVTVNIVDIELECDFDDGIINWGSTGTISVANAPDGAVYSWSNGETGSSIEVSPTDDTSYSVTVTDAIGCTDVATKDVEVRQVNCGEEGVFLPTAFSPNNDGINDRLILRSLWIDDIDVFIVYDRWGEEVYNANGLLDGWDGTFQNNELEPDVYAYCIKGTCIDGTEFTQVGNVSLLK